MDSVLLESLSKQLSASIDPAYYLESLHFKAFEWQKTVLKPGTPRLILNCARQSGKSTVIAAKVVHRAKHFPGSLIMLFAPTENQAVELMEKISIFLALDPDIILVRDSSVTKKFLNSSRIKAFTASPKSARGYSDPDIIVFDEAAQVDRELYLTVRPMMTGEKTDLILLSTPFGEDGFFYDIWVRDTDIWVKVEVQPIWIMDKVMPEKFGPRDDTLWIESRKAEGINAYISPRHTEKHLLEEFEEMGEHWYLQEYGCEFRAPVDTVFDKSLFMQAFTPDTELMDREEVNDTDGELLW